VAVSVTVYVPVRMGAVVGSAVPAPAAVPKSGADQWYVTANAAGAATGGCTVKVAGAAEVTRAGVTDMPGSPNIGIQPPGAPVLSAYDVTSAPAGTAYRLPVSHRACAPPAAVVSTLYSGVPEKAITPAAV
jgi:hypothetical protein